MYMKKLPISTFSNKNKGIDVFELSTNAMFNRHSSSGLLQYLLVGKFSVDTINTRHFGSAKRVCHQETIAHVQLKSCRCARTKNDMYRSRNKDTGLKNVHRNKENEMHNKFTARLVTRYKPDW